MKGCFYFIFALILATITINNILCEDISNQCIGCLCEVASSCNLTIKCEGDLCGPFRITWGYWADSGKPTQPSDHPNSENAFKNCVNEPQCAAAAVRAYMQKFSQDCNNDGVINCLDYAHIHRLGGYGCNEDLPKKYRQMMIACMQEFNIS